jgi:hypothetical protein
MIKLPYFADPKNLEVVEDEPVQSTIPDNIPLPSIADEVVRGKRTLSKDQMRLLIELLPYYLPKLSATAHINFDLARELDKEIARCIKRSKSPVPLLNGPVEPLPASELKKPFVRSNYRRF